MWTHYPAIPTWSHLSGTGQKSWKQNYSTKESRVKAMAARKEETKYLRTKLFSFALMEVGWKKNRREKYSYKCQSFVSASKRMIFPGFNFMIEIFNHLSGESDLSREREINLCLPRSIFCSLIKLGTPFSLFQSLNSEPGKFLKSLSENWLLRIKKTFATKLHWNG